MDMTSNKIHDDVEREDSKVLPVNSVKLDELIVFMLF